MRVTHLLYRDVSPLTLRSVTFLHLHLRVALLVTPTRVCGARVLILLLWDVVTHLTVVSQLVVRICVEKQ